MRKLHSNLWLKNDKILPHMRYNVTTAVSGG